MAILSPPLPRIETAARVQLDAPASLRLWHLTSLDAPTVAVTWTLAFAWSTRIRLPLWLPIVLGLAAWSFYIADRLFDARNARTPLRARHHFHWRHRRIFIPLAVASLLSAGALVLYFMPLAARARNSVLAVATIAYFTSVHIPWRPKIPRLTLRLPKELLVAVIFTLACTVPVWARNPSDKFTLLISILVFIALAWLNCYAIEAWESHSNSMHPPVTFRFAIALAGIALSSTAVTAALHQQRPTELLAAAACSAALIALLDCNRSNLTPITLRCSADFVLLVPVLLLALP